MALRGPHSAAVDPESQPCVGSRSAIDDYLGLRAKASDYSEATRSLSPFYSNAGIRIDEDGTTRVLLHYNRMSRPLLKPLLSTAALVDSRQSGPASITEHFNGGQSEIAFFTHDAWIVETHGLEAMAFSVAEQTPLQELRRQEAANDVLLFKGYLDNPDVRDPDERVPITLGFRIMAGETVAGNGIDEPLQLRADDAGGLVLAFALDILDEDDETVCNTLKAATITAAEAIGRTRSWLAAALGDYRVPEGNEDERVALALAVHALLSNTVAAPGLLAGRLAGMPNRNTYSAPWIWDCCFQNLGVELLEPRLAEDALLLFIENQRPDGKIPMFVCSTWVRPHLSISPLLGWAGVRLVRDRGDRALAARLLPALEHNTHWWRTQRTTRFGLVFGHEGQESGNDNSPLYDRGPIVACDLNSYLLLQMRACATLASELGDETHASALRAEADRFARQMVDVLFDADAGLFWPIHLESGERIKIKTPHCFTPLLADVPLPEAKCRQAIEGVLLNPAHFCGDVPFPMVAYDEACYDAEDFWRGPTWMNIAYLMLRILDKYGYADEARSARETLYRILIEDRSQHEWFNSQTGEGLGAPEYGWTAAVCLRLKRELSSTGVAT